MVRHGGKVTSSEIRPLPRSPRRRGEKRGRNFNSWRLGALEIDHEFEFVWLLEARNGTNIIGDLVGNLDVMPVAARR